VGSSERRQERLRHGKREAATTAEDQIKQWLQYEWFATVGTRDYDWFGDREVKVALGADFSGANFQRRGVAGEELVQSVEDSFE
jgi:hypothetical protein